MSTEPRKPHDPSDPATWPVVECEPTDVFLGSFVRDCTPHLTDEQKAWPVVECEPTDVFLDAGPRAAGVEPVGGEAFVLRGRDATGRAAWYVVLVAPDRRAAFERAATGDLDPTAFGRVLASGYGPEPPRDARGRIAPGGA